MARKAKTFTDVRILSATHKDLAAEVEAGRFRQDLYYRLNVIELRIPSLREHVDDIPELAAASLQRLAREYGGGTAADFRSGHAGADAVRLSRQHP